MYRTKKSKERMVEATMRLSQRSGSSAAPTQEHNPDQKRIDDDDMFFNFTQPDIPATQDTSQLKYISQRSAASQRTQESQDVGFKIPATSNTAYTVFDKLMQKCSVDLISSDTATIGINRFSFAKTIEENIGKDDTKDLRIKQFVSGYKKHLGSTTSSMKLLMPYKSNARGNSFFTKVSLTKEFLSISSLQEPLLNVILDKIKELSSRNYNIRVDSIGELRQLLLHLQYIDQMKYKNMIYSFVTEVIFTCSIEYQMEIFIQSVLFIHSSQHAKFVSEMIEKLSDNVIMSAPVIKALGNFNLTSEIHKVVKKKLIDWIDNNRDVKVLPAITAFALGYNFGSKSECIETINDLKCCLTWKNCSPTERDNTQKIVFNTINNYLNSSSMLFDCWRKTLQAEVEEFTSFDFIICLILVSINDEKGLVLENMIRNKIKQDILKYSILTDAKENFSIILEEYYNAFLNVSRDLLSTKEWVISQFGYYSFKILFSIPNVDHRLLLSKLMDFIRLPNLGNDLNLAKTKTNALNLLMDINRENPNRMNEHGMILISLLDDITVFTLSQYRNLMELISDLCFPNKMIEPNLILQEQIDLIIRKQLCSVNKTDKRLGVIAAIRVINRMIHVSDSECPSVNSQDQLSIADISDVYSKDAAKLMDFMFSLISSCSHLLSFCYDELAYTLSQEFSNNTDNDTKINGTFLKWICNRITDDFQTNYVVTELPTSPIALDFFHCINTMEEIDYSGSSNSSSNTTIIGINIAGKCLIPEYKSESSIELLSPTFNLLRILFSLKYNGNLELINAIIGCAVILPQKYSPSDWETLFADNEPDVSKRIIDSFIFTANWFRVLISAFVSQNDETIKTKVLQRLSQLIELERSIKLLLDKCPFSYQPPYLDFMDDKLKSGIGKHKLNHLDNSSYNKRSKQYEKENQEEDSLLAPTAKTQNTSKINMKGKSHGNQSSYDYKFEYSVLEQYRAMDTEIIFLLRETFDCDGTTSKGEFGNSIGLEEYRFIIHNIIVKLELISGSGKLTDEHLRQYISNPDVFITIIVANIPFIMKIFTRIVNDIGKLREVRNKANMDTADIYDKRSNYLKICLAQTLKLFTLLLSLPNLHSKANEHLLLPLLLSLISNIPNANEIDENDQMAIQIFAIKGFIYMEKIILDLQSGVQLYQLVRAIGQFTQSSKIPKWIGTLCYDLLSSKWYNYYGNLERGSSINILLDELLKGFTMAANIITIKNVLQWLTIEINSLNNKEAYLNTFPMFNKSNFPLLYRSLCAVFIDNIKRNSLVAKQSSCPLTKWEESADILNQLLNIVKISNESRNYTTFMKFSHLYVQVFMKNAMPVMENLLRTSPDRVANVFHQVQKTTKYLHNICCHVKSIKITSLISQIPNVRKTLEEFTIKVKMILASNSCSDAYWMGNLKNKDINGEEILTQTSILTSENSSTDNLPDQDELYIEDNSNDMNYNEESIRIRPSTSRSKFN